MTNFLYIAAILLMLWLVLDATTREYQTMNPIPKNENIIKYAPKMQKKVDKIFKRDFNPLVKMIKEEEKYYKKTGKNSNKWLSAMSRLQKNEKKYGKADVGRYIPKKYKNYKFPWEKKKDLERVSNAVQPGGMVLYGLNYGVQNIEKSKI